MKNYILIAFATLFFISCSSLKDLQRKDNTVEKTDIERRTITRAGDTITIEVPNIKYKDTTITRTNYITKQAVRIQYDKEGNQKIDCIGAELRETLELIRKVVEKDVTEKDKRKSEFNPQYFIYALMGLGIVIIVGFTIFGVMIMKLQRSMPSIIAQVSKEMLK